MATFLMTYTIVWLALALYVARLALVQRRLKRAAAQISVSSVCPSPRSRVGILER
jgi:CcmD family protein